MRASTMPITAPTPRRSTVTQRSRASRMLAARNTIVSTINNQNPRLATTRSSCAHDTDSWALDRRSLWYTTSCPKSSGRSRPVASSSWAICWVGSPSGVSSGILSRPGTPRSDSSCSPRDDQRQEVDRHLAVDDADPVGQAVAFQELHRSVVGPGHHAGDEIGDPRTREHDPEGALGEVVHRRPQHRLQPIERRRQLLDDRVRELQVGGDRVGEVGGEGRLDLGVGDRVACDRRRGGAVEDRRPRPHRDHGQHEAQDGEHPAHDGGRGSYPTAARLLRHWFGRSGLGRHNLGRHSLFPFSSWNVRRNHSHRWGSRRNNGSENTSCEMLP